LQCATAAGKRELTKITEETSGKHKIKNRKLKQFPI
jgi:hypothetical protein